MKKTLTLVASLFMAATMANAEVPEITQDPAMVEFADLNTDAAYLESKSALLAAPAPDAPKDAKYWAEAVGSRVKVMAYAQGGYQATFNEDAPNSNTFNFARCVLMVGADIAPKFYAFFMHEFKSGSVQEYYMEYRPSKAVNFRLGQSKIELSMENIMSPTVLESLNMSQGVFWLCGADPLMNNACGRDNGLMMYGDLFKNKLHYVVEVLNGGQVNTSDKNNQKNIIAKLEYKPVPNLRFSVSGQKGYGYAVGTSVYNPTIKVGETYRQDRYAAGFEWKSKKTGNDYNRNRCTTIRCEALGGRDGEVGSFGVYGSAHIPVYKQLDVVAMADYFNKNTDLGTKQTNLMAGVQYWLHKKCRLQAQYQYSIKSDAMKAITGGNYSQILTQVQVAF